jgi:hypothetical protein
LSDEQMHFVRGLPKIYVQCREAYNAMRRTARPAEPDGTIIWEGFLTSFLKEELGYDSSRYSRITTTLKEMGCIQQVARGSGRNNPSEWALIGEPTLDGFAYYKEKTGKRYHKVNLERQRIKDLVNTVSLLNQRVEHIEALLGVEDGQD